MRDRVLVTGSNGFIGSYLAYEFRNYYDIDGIDRGVDCCDYYQLSTYMKRKKYQCIVHLASEIPVTSKWITDEYIIKNTQMIVNLSRCCLSQWENGDGMPFVVFTSSSSVYGTPDEEKVDEKSLIKPDNYYALSKYLCELILQQYEKERNLDVCILRLSSPYGYGMNQNAVIAKFIKYAFNGDDIGVWGTGLRSQDFIYIKDVVQAISLACKMKNRGVYNISSGESTTMIKLAQIIKESIPESKSQISRNSNMEDAQDKYKMTVSIEKARTILGYNPQYDIQKGIIDYVKRIRDSRS